MRQRIKSDNMFTFDVADECVMGYPNTYDKEKVDHFFHNPYMNKGYRVGYSIKDCAYSIFLFHNETWNIWTHLLPAALLLISYIILVGGDFLMLPNWSDSLMLHINFIGTFCGLFLSAAYHTFNCNSKEVHDCLLCGDMAGAITFMVSVMMPCVHFAFACHPRLQILYVTLSAMIFLMGNIIAYLSNHPTYGYRLRVYGLPLLNSIGIGILVHMYLVIPSSEWELWSPYQYTLISLIVGITVYAIRFPEKWFPVFCEKTHLYSHGLWHFCTDVTAVIGCVQIMRVSNRISECVH